MLVLALMLAAMGCWIGAAVAGLVAGRDRVPTALGVLAAALGLGGALAALLGAPAAELAFPFWGGGASLEVDALSAAFLAPLHLVAGLGMVYGRAYWPLDAPRGGRWLRFGYGLLAAAMTLVFTARQGVLFLVGWEVMAMAAMLLIGTEHERPEVLRGTWVYLACTHTGTVFLVAMVALMGPRLGGLAWHASNPLPHPGLDAAILLLALVGFGFKAGLAPLHFWLPAAHAGAPSHVSAILSAVMLKAGVYGVLRIAGLLPPVPHLGGAVLALGAATALFGAGCALAQRDYKRLLAYSSIENIGIIFMGVGLGWAGRAAGNPWLAALGFGGALLHVWNHAAFKSLLFFGAGAALHATGTRDLEAAGGLGARMPRTALAMLPATLAVAALPPFNGFLSEWLLYRGFLASIRAGGAWLEGLALMALALTGGLAAVAFAKFFGFLFLGEPRSEAAAHAHDPHPDMGVPMAVLAGLCLALSLGGCLLLGPLDRVLAVLLPAAAGQAPGPLAAGGLGRDLGLMAVLSALLLALGGLALRAMRDPRRRSPDRPGTWDCGYARPTARMQYSASSFADAWSGKLPGFRQRIRRVRGLFPAAVAYHSEFQDPVGGGVVAPRTERIVHRLLGYRRLQQGQLSVYLLYILITLVVVCLWLVIRPRLLG
jgi:formate hydrogenlyase subunit 3/multisubunit Na+/H+ antiporter MnhD subunit